MAHAPQDRESVERVLMDRARSQAERATLKLRRPLLQQVIALVLAAAVVAVVLLGFDAFLTSFQKFLEIGNRAPSPAATAPTAPMPAYVVPPEVSPPPQADQSPHPRRDEAPDTSRAKP
jgi:hypothetical protein